MQLLEISGQREKQAAARAVLENLTEWFGIPEAREEYIQDSAGQICIAAWDQGRTVGFICLKETGQATLEIAVMGVLKEFHRQGIGRGLFQRAREIATEKGYSFLQVKTVQMGKYESYDKTNRFYLSLGFQEFEVFPTLWDEHNPCQVYIISLK